MHSVYVYFFAVPVIISFSAEQVTSSSVVVKWKGSSNSIIDNFIVLYTHLCDDGVEGNVVKVISVLLLMYNTFSSECGHLQWLFKQYNSKQSLPWNTILYQYNSY